MSRWERVVVATWLLLLTALSYFIFPGHTWLQSDTQIYFPILQHLYDASYFTKEILAQRPHVSFTVYDEVAVGLRRLTGLGFEEVLTLQQWLFRFCGLLGVFLIGRRLQLQVPAALFVCGLFTLGATITGPAVLLIEYEPVPRAFAVPLIFLALGLLVSERPLLGGIAAGLATMYHFPSAAPFLTVLPAYLFLRWRDLSVRERVLPMIGIGGALAVIATLAALEPKTLEPQPLFASVAPDVEKLQQFRAAYNWLGMWDSYWILYYAMFALFLLVLVRRMRGQCPEDLRVWVVGLGAVGVWSMPLSYVLLDVLRWSLIPQIQPARATLYIIGCFFVVAGAVAMHAIENHKWWRGALLLLFLIAIPTGNKLTDLVEGTQTGLAWWRLVLVLVMACGIAFALRAQVLRQYVAPFLALIPLFVLPTAGEVRNYPKLGNAELSQVSQWARNATDKQALFQFPDVDRSLEPGVFRAESLRALYVDRKGGGQVNFLPELGREWWRRWNQVMGKPLNAAQYRGLGIDYVVLTKAQWPVEGSREVFRNARYRVLQIPEDASSASTSVR